MKAQFCSLTLLMTLAAGSAFAGKASDPSMRLGEEVPASAHQLHVLGKNPGKTTGEFARFEAVAPKAQGDTCKEMPASRLQMDILRKQEPDRSLRQC